MKTTVSIIALIVSTTSVAHAQDAAPPPSNDAQIQEVIVTAERRSATTQKTAAAVSAISALALSKSVTSPQDISKIVPAISIGTGGGGNTQVAIRGIGTLSGNSYSEQAVATNLDGVYISRPSAVNGTLFDLERVEVLKGPQGTLYGRNATAGALNLITKKPSFTDGGDITVDIGNYNAKRIQGAVNLAVTDKLALRFAGQVVQHDGYLEDGYNDADSQSVRASLRYEPTTTLRLNLSVDYSKVGGMGGNGIIASAYDPTDPFKGPSSPSANGIYAAAGVKQIGDDGYLRSNVLGVTGSLDWDTSAGTLSIIPGFRHSTANYLHYSAGFPITAHEGSDTQSLEIRFASPREAAFSYIVGAYAFSEKQDFHLLADQTVTYSDSDIRKLDTDSWAAFAQGMWRITDATRLTAGVRYSADDKSVAGTVTTPLPAVPPFLYPVVCPTPAVYGTTTCTSPVVGSAQFSKPTWKVSLEHDLSDNNLLYANVGTGFKAGGFYSSLAPNTFKPETLLAYAIGSKNRFFDRTLQLNLEAYYWSYKNKQVTHLGPVNPAGFDLITENAGEATLYGVDTDLTWKPSAADTISATLQYEHSVYDSFVYTQDTSVSGPPSTSCIVTGAPPAVVTVDCSGHVLAKAPEWSGNLSYNRVFDVKSGSLSFTISEKFDSDYWLGDEQIDGQKQKAYNMTDLELAYSPLSAKWTFAVYGANLENVAVKSSSFVQPVLGQPVVVLRPPRTYGVRLSARF